MRITITIRQGNIISTFICIPFTIYKILKELVYYY